MKRLELSKLVIRIVAAWLLLSTAVLLYSRPIIDFYLPFLSVITDTVSDPYTPTLEYQDLPRGDQLLMTAYVTQPIYAHSALTVNIGAEMTAGLDVLHIVVPLVILFTALCAWPIHRWRERVALVALGLPASFAVMGLTVPFLLTGKIEMMLNDYVVNAGEDRSIPLQVYWMIFCESGANWLIPLVAAAFCALRLHPALDCIHGVTLRLKTSRLKITRAP